VAVPLTATDDDRELERLELELLLEAIHRRYGYDFRGYAHASLRRRLWRRADLEGLRSLSGLQERVLHDPETMQRLLADLSINVTAMFRDPSFHAALRERVFPLLRTNPFNRVWVAGCSTGEEVVSLAISLREEGMLDRARIYATDMDAAVLDRARAGAFGLDKLQDYTRNYLAAGGREAFSAYYAVAGDAAVFDPALLRDVVFAQHNLATDRSFNEFQLVVCRNVLIYFGRELQDRVLGLFDESLARRGVLALGRKETLHGTAVDARYEPLVEDERIYRRRA
jgi:chemotaxis protein methyltransferase CheR